MRQVTATVEVKRKSFHRNRWNLSNKARPSAKPPPDGYKHRSTEPEFVIVETMARELVSSEPIAAGSDLRTVITAARTRMAAEGWAVEDLAKYQPYFFDERDGRRVMVRIGFDPDTLAERRCLYRR